MPTLSAVIIAKNEERDIPHALASLAGLADETIVLADENNSDQTLEIARRHGAKVSIRKFDNFAAHKQAALDLARGEWVLSLDCDERVSPELSCEIVEKLPQASKWAGFEIPFKVYFLGRRLRFGGLGRESHLRLFRRTAGRFVGGRLHEGIEVSGAVGRLRGAICHESYKDIAEYLAKLDHYTDLAAQKRFEGGARFHAWQHLVLPGEFFLRAALKLGFLDGRAGMIYAGLCAFHSWLKYVKLSRLEERC